MLPSVIIFHSLFCVSQKVDRWNRLRANGWIHSYGGLVGSDSAKMGSTPETLWPEASVAAGQYLVRNPKLSKTWIRIILFFWLFSKDNNNKKKKKKQTRRRIKTTDSSSSFLMIMPPLTRETVQTGIFFFFFFFFLNKRKSLFILFHFLVASSL